MSPTNMSACFESVRSMNAFKPHEGDDGRLGHVCSTKLGGDWVLAESDQVAPSCTGEQVLAAYLDGRLRLYAAMLLIACATFAAQLALVGALAAARRPRRRDAARSTLFSRFTFGSSPALSRGPSWWRPAAPAAARESAPLDYTRATDVGQRRGTM